MFRIYTFKVFYLEGQLSAARNKAKNPVIIIRDRFGKAIMKVPKAAIELDADRRHVRPGASDTNGVGALKPGDRMPDGTIFAGISPALGRRIFVAPQDASVAMKWKAAQLYALDLDAHGHQDWKVPSREELELLYRNRNKGALKGTFNARGRYWSSEAPSGIVVTGTLADVLAARMLVRTPTDALWRRFSDGRERWDWPSCEALVRLVRSEPCS